MDWGYSLSGLIVGLIVGMTGVGGGSLMTPLLVTVFGISPATAVGTDLLYAAVTKAGGVWVHGRRGHVDWTLVGRLAAGSIPAAILTVAALGLLGVKSKHFSTVVMAALGAALILTALALLFRERLTRLARSRGEWLGGPDSAARHQLTVAIGAVLGMLVAISSVGAGALGVVALVLLYPKLSAVRIVGCDIAHAVPLTLAAGLGHFALGTVDFTLLGSLLLGSLPGIYIGSHISAKIPERLLRRMLAVLLVAIGGKLMAMAV